MNQPIDRRLSTARSASKSRSATRRFLERLLRGGREIEPASRGRLLLETLEPRQLLAGDVEMFSTVEAVPDDSYIPAQYDASSLQGEGEAADDLVAFAKALDDAGVTFYGAAWCPVCLEQKTLFGDGKEELPFVEVTNPDRTLNSIGQAENITQFPTWEFPDSSRAVGLLSLAELSQRSGVAIPQSENPTFAPVGNQTVEIGSPLHVPIDGYDPDGSALTVTVSVADPTLLSATVLQGNRSARVNVQGWGSMVFELFEDRAPRPTARFIELAQAGFFNADGEDQIIFHRIIDDFVLQAGDPTGTGSGGSALGDFDDQFHPELQHNRSGILSYAKSFDDTNDSQFFITEGATRHLDFNHSIFGQLVEGEVVREAISETKTTSSRPDVPVVIDSVEIFNDAANSVLMLKPTGNGTGQTDVTITVTDADGNVSTEVITVTVTPDAVNAAPYLEDIDPVSTSAGTPAVIQLEGVDVEGDAIVYEARVTDSSGATATVNQSTGQVTVTPAANFSGQILVEVAARSASTPTSTSASTRSSTMDLQVVPVTVGPVAPTGVTLNAASDSGSSNSDRVTKTTPLSFTVTGVTPGATVEILAGNVQVGAGTATTSTIVITTNNFAALGNAEHLVTARQTVGGIQSPKSSAITVTFDTAVPGLSPVIPSQASVGVPYLANMQNSEEGAGLQYALTSGPAGMTVDATNGAIAWTPTAAQTGDHTVVIALTDLAGNSREQTYTINVGSDPLVVIRLEAVDAAGNVLTQLVPGQEFKLNVYGDDQRASVLAQGIFSLYTDILFNSDLAEVVAENPIEYDPMYSSGQRGTVSTGLVDEVGSFSSQISSVGGQERRIFSVNMRAIAGGNLTIASDPADGNTTEVTLFDSTSDSADEVPDNRIVYGALNLTVNSTFTATNDTATVAEDSSNNTITPLANDTVIATGTTLTLSSVSATSASGTVQIVGNTLRYTPPANYVGVDEFTYTVTDQNGGSQTATVSVTVQNENDPPSAADDTVEVIEGSTLNQIDVLANDASTPDTGETLTVSAVGTSSAGGTVTIGTSGSHILYTPPANFTGTDTFTYTLSDGTLTDTATVTVTVVAGNPPPTAVNDSFSVSEDAAAADFDVVANDSTSDPDETFSLVSVGSSTNATVTRSADGTKLRYQPKANFNGIDTVTYTIQDSNGATATATATFSVAAVNDPPPAPARTAQTAKGMSNVQVLDVADLTAANVDSSETLTISAVGTASGGGTVAIASDGKSIRYTPPTATFTGTDSFSYTIRDAAGATTSGTLTVSVLDFIPRDFVVSLGHPPTSTVNYYSRITAKLTGIDYTGQSVDVDGTYQASAADSPASLRFEGQAPGTYEVEIPAVPFLQGTQSTQRFTIDSGAEDTDAVELPVSVGSLMPEYLSIRDFLSSAPKSHVFAVVRVGQSQTWAASTTNSTTPGNPVISLSADGQQVRIEVDAASGSGRRAATLPIADSRIDVRASDGEYRLLRINVDPAEVTYTAVTGSSSASTAAAGSTESSTASTSSADTSTGSGSSANSNTGSSSGTGSAEAEGEAAPASTTAASTGTSTQPSGGDQPASATSPTITAATTKSSVDDSLAAGEGEGDAGRDLTDLAPQTAPLAAEGEGQATPPIVSAATGISPLADRGNDIQTSAAPLLSNFSAASATTQAVDQAMLELLPQLELRSATGEALADPEKLPNLETLDQTFGLLTAKANL